MAISLGVTLPIGAAASAATCSTTVVVPGWAAVTIATLLAAPRLATKLRGEVRGGQR